MALQRARLQFKRDYPDDPKGIDEYKSRALLDAMAEAKRGAIGSRVLGEAYYKMKDREDKRVAKLLAAKESNAPYAIADGNVYVNKNIAPMAIGSLMSALALTPRAEPSSTKKATSKPTVSGTPGRKPIIKLTKIPKRPPPTIDRLKEEYEETTTNALRIRTEAEAARRANETDEYERLLKQSTALDKAAQKKLKDGVAKRQAWEASRTPAAAGPSGLTQEERDDTPTLTPAQTTQTLNLINDVVANGITDGAIRAIRSSDTPVKQAVEKALSSMIPEGSRRKEPTPLSREAAALLKTFDDVGQTADEDRARQIEDELARQYGRNRPLTEQQLRSQAAEEEIQAQLEREQAMRENAARIAETRKARRAMQNEEAQAAIERGRAIKEANAPKVQRLVRKFLARRKDEKDSETELARVREIQRLAEEASAQEEQVRAQQEQAMRENAARIAETRKARREMQNEEAQAAIERGRAIKEANAPKVQNVVRGFLARRKLASLKAEKEEEVRQAMVNQAVKEQLAATKIQSLQRGRKTRKGLFANEADKKRELEDLFADMQDVGDEDVVDEEENVSPSRRVISTQERIERALAQSQINVPGTSIRPDTELVEVALTSPARMSNRQPPLPVVQRIIPTPPPPPPPAKGKRGPQKTFTIREKRQFDEIVNAPSAQEITDEAMRELGLPGERRTGFDEADLQAQLRRLRPAVERITGRELTRVEQADLSPLEIALAARRRGINPPDVINVDDTDADWEGDGLVGRGLSRSRTFTGGVLRRLRGMGYFDGFDSLMYNIHGTPDDNKKDLADAKAAYAARGGSIVLSGVPTPTGGAMRGSGADADQYKLHFVAFPDDKWTTSSSLRWLRSNGIVPIKKAMHIPEYYKYQILPPSDNKDYMTHELMSRGRKILLGYARPS